MPSSQQAGAAGRHFLPPNGKVQNAAGATLHPSPGIPPPPPESTGPREGGTGSQQDLAPNLPCGHGAFLSLSGVRLWSGGYLRTHWLPQAESPGPPAHRCPGSAPHLPFSLQERNLLFGFHNLLHYYFITFQMTGNRIDFVSLLAWRTWSAFIIESDFIGFHFFCVYGRRRGPPAWHFHLGE